MQSKISMLFEELDEHKGKYDRVLLRRDILLWYLKSIEIGKPITSFKYNDVAYYLIKKHQPIIKKYEGSHYNEYSRVQKQRTYITARIKDLILLGLIRISKSEPSERNKDLITEIYTFTEEGYVVSLLLESWYTTGERRQAMMEKFLLQLCIELKKYSSSLTRCLVECFLMLVKKGYCKTLDKEYLQLFLPLFPLGDNPFRFVRFSLINILYSNELTSKIFLEVLDKLEEEEKKLVLIQLKLDIESNYFDGIGASSEWESIRFKNINNPYLVTIQGYCLDCRNATCTSMFTKELLRTEQNPKQMNSTDGEGIIAKRGGCNICASGDARIIYPLWFNPANWLLPRITNFEKLEKVYAIWESDL